MTTFKINNIFEITKRGYVLAGDILEGNIESGDLLSIPPRKSLVITSVEFIDYNNGKAKIGLMLGALSVETQNLLKKSIGDTISIIKAG